jgi:hypothetical protein
MNEDIPPEILSMFELSTKKKKKKNQQIEEIKLREEVVEESLFQERDDPHYSYHELLNRFYT